MSGKSLWLANIARKVRAYGLGVIAVWNQGRRKEAVSVTGNSAIPFQLYVFSLCLLLPLKDQTYLPMLRVVKFIFVYVAETS